MNPTIAMTLIGLAMRPNLDTYSESETVVFIDVCRGVRAASPHVYACVLVLVLVAF